MASVDFSFVLRLTTFAGIHIKLSDSTLSRVISFSLALYVVEVVLLRVKIAETSQFFCAWGKVFSLQAPAWSEPPTVRRHQSRHESFANISSESNDEESRRVNLEEETARTRAAVDRANRVLLDVQEQTNHLPILPPSGREPRRRRRKPQRSREPPSSIHHCDQQHYHLNMAHIPFVVGTSTTPSHSVTGSLQEVLAQLKRHHPIICNHVHSRRSRHSQSVRQPSCAACTMASSQQQQALASHPAARSSLNTAKLLRDMKTLRTTLERDDLCWSWVLVLLEQPFVFPSSLCWSPHCCRSWRTMFVHWKIDLPHHWKKLSDLRNRWWILIAVFPVILVCWLYFLLLFWIVFKWLPIHHQSIWLDLSEFFPLVFWSFRLLDINGSDKKKIALTCDGQVEGPAYFRHYYLCTLEMSTYQ